MEKSPVFASRSLVYVIPTAILVLSTIATAATVRAQEPAPEPKEKHGRAFAPPGSEKAVLDGLRWLVRHQNPDGSWSPTTLKERCPCDDPMYNPKTAYTNHYDEGLTGLALLCFLRAGFTPESKQDIVDTAMGKRHKVGDVVKTGLQWLVKRQHADGSFSSARAFMYNEAIASLALTTAYGLTHDEAAREPAQRSIQFIQGAQRPAPSGGGLWGWRYASRQDIEAVLARAPEDAASRRELLDADTSITGWCTQALERGARSGLTVDPQNLAGALAFTKWVSSDKGLVGYLDPKGAGATVTGPNDHFTYHPAVMSALGICTRLWADGNTDDPFLELAARRIVEDLPHVSADKLSIDYYYWLHATLALRQLGGPDATHETNKDWGPWDKALKDAVLSLQDHAERACTNGGWMVPDRWSYSGGPIYTTAMNLLTLEVDYAYGPK